MEDHPGVLASVLKTVSTSNMNILTIIQNIPVDGMAEATISLQTKEEKLRDVEASLEEIRSVKGVRDLRIIGNN